MEDNYLRSLKKSILDYVLMDEGEQDRLGLTMKKQVCYFFVFYNTYARA